MDYSDKLLVRTGGKEIARVPRRDTNVEQLTEACAELIEDKNLRDKLGETGRESVKEKFAPEKMIDTIEALYLKLLP